MTKRRPYQYVYIYIVKGSYDTRARETTFWNTDHRKPKSEKLKICNDGTVVAQLLLFLLASGPGRFLNVFWLSFDAVVGICKVTISSWLCHLAFRLCCSGWVPPFEKSSCKGLFEESQDDIGRVVCYVNNSALCHLESALGFWESVSRWQVSRVGGRPYSCYPWIHRPKDFQGIWLKLKVTPRRSKASAKFKAMSPSFACAQPDMSNTALNARVNTRQPASLSSVGELSK